ncbi:LysR family transcriptional regulator [Mycolicibacterium madagascariense]|uniref:Probable hydrogen peroxide-inducible genes activator n=1 Tax=Mycolicibacterium madagascariense TaxID=212765 RepID=A0A7I7XFJ5_9MYCO|nr:LysR family transcriptional regulator [Mycolicibacterium madagascariense]BBZ27959.1 LysR family transcriptional regulator [Mycolicibacterium madagascariense]
MAKMVRVDDMTLAGLRVCREIALLGSFTAAARSLGYSQPAISRQVAAMEAAAGLPLFVRTARGVSLSAAGHAVVTHAGRILGDVESLRHDLDGLGDRLAGRVRLGVFPTAAAVLAPRTIALLAAEHPGLDIRLSEASTPSLLRELRRGRLAVAVIGAGAGLPDYDLDGLAVHRVFSGDLCVAVPIGHRLASATTAVAVGELTGEPWVIGDGSAGDPQFAAWPTLADPIVAHRVRGWQARLGMVAAGLGICLLPELAAPSVPAGVAIVRVQDPTWMGRVTLAVAGPSPGPSESAVIEALQAAGHSIGSAERSSATSDLKRAVTDPPRSRRRPTLP